MTVIESTIAKNVPFAADLLKGRDHFDISSVPCDKSLLDFKEKLVSYHPGWIKALYKVREYFLKILKIPQVQNFEPVYTTVASDEKSFWIGVIADTHLTAHLGVVREQLDQMNSVFHVFSIVHYHSIKGKIYFSLIRPFHYVVVYFMMRSAALE